MYGRPNRCSRRRKRRAPRWVCLHDPGWARARSWLREFPPTRQPRQLLRRLAQRYRLELGVDYIDILLLHCMQKGNWPADNRGSMDYLMQAKQEGIIRAHGTSCHGIDPLSTAAKSTVTAPNIKMIRPSHPPTGSPTRRHRNAN